MHEVMPIREGAVAIVSPDTTSPPATQAPEGSSDASVEMVEIEELEVELDYDAMEAGARLQPRSGVNWLAAFSGAKTYEETLSPQYELASDDGT